MAWMWIRLKSAGQNEPLGLEGIITKELISAPLSNESSLRSRRSDVDDYYLYLRLVASIRESIEVVMSAKQAGGLLVLQHEAASAGLKVTFPCPYMISLSDVVVTTSNKRVTTHSLFHSERASTKECLVGIENAIQRQNELSTLTEILTPVLRVPFSQKMPSTVVLPMLRDTTAPSPVPVPVLPRPLMRPLSIVSLRSFSAKHFFLSCSLTTSFASGRRLALTC